MANSGTEVARAYVTIIPKSDGTSNEVIASVVNPIQEKVSDAGSKSGGLFNANLGKVLSKFAAPVAIGTALTGIGKYAVDAFNEVDAGIDNLIIATGAQGEAAEELKNVYKDVARSVTGDFGDIGSAVGELNTRLGLNGDALEAASESAMKYAAVTGQDATKAIQDVTKMMNNAGIPAEEYASMLDKLTVAGQQAGVDVSKLAQSVNSNAASFKELGFSTDEAIAMLAQFDKSGADTSGILAGMKKGVQNWAKEGKSAKDGFADFVKGVEDGSVTSADAIKIFGAKAGLTMFDAAQKGQLSFEDMYAAIEGSAGALNSVYEDTLDAPDKLALAWQNVKITAADAAAPLMDIASNVLESAIIPAIQNASTVASDFMQRAGELYDTYVAPIVDQAITVIPPVIDNVKTTVENGVQAAGSVFNAVMPQIQQLIDDVWPDIQAIIQDVMGIIQETVVPAWTFIESHMSVVMDGALKVIKTVWPVITSVIKKAVSVVRSTISSIRSVIATVRSTFNSIKSAMTEPIQSAKETISGIIQKVKEFFPIKLGNIFSGLKLPHFKISGGEVPWGIGGLGTAPHVDVEWYAKAMDQPYMLTKPTILGAGEAGDEIVYGKESLMNDIKEAIGEGTLTDELIERLESMVDSIIEGVATVIAASRGNGGDIHVTLYAYPGGPQMDKVIVRSYDRGKKNGLK